MFTLTEGCNRTVASTLCNRTVARITTNPCGTQLTRSAAEGGMQLAATHSHTRFPFAVSLSSRCQLAMATCLRTVAGSSSSASMQAARSARETWNPCGRLRSIAMR